MRPDETKAVRRLGLFEAMSDAAFEALTRAALVQSFPIHVELIHEGGTADFLHLVLDGLVELYSVQGDRQTTIGLVRPVSTFVLAAVVTDRHYLVSARTRSRARILLLPAEAVRAALAQALAFARAVVEELALRYRDAVGELKSHKQRTAAQRLARWILSTDEQAGHPGRFRLPVEKRVLASHLGMTPENLSRAFVALGHHGVRVSGRDISILHPEKLARLAEHGLRGREPP